MIHYISAQTKQQIRRLRNVLSILAVAVLVILLINTVINQSAIAHNPKQHPLIRQQVSQIRRLRNKAGIPLVMPTYIPRGFRLTEFVVNIDDNGEHGSYDALYKGPNNCQIGVNGADGGWGAGQSITQKIVNTMLLGKLILETELEIATWKPTNSLFTLATPQYGDQPFSKPKYSPIKSFPKAGYIFDFKCQNKMFNLKEASKILQSLQLFNI